MSTEAESPQMPQTRLASTQALLDVLPADGVEVSSKRILNIWGEHEVGKSHFIQQTRESEALAKSHILWMQPTRKGKLDTIPEFIRACSETLTHTSDPKKEKKIAAQLENAQRGKVNPLVSDDSILITRSSIAEVKKPYVNQAAASSVGRTEKAREEIEVDVGLGESKSTNHAEGFLDALPLKSLGTNLTILYLDSLDALSVSIIDWLRDYVFPAATRGPYRRSLILITECLDPLALAQPHETWGEWGDLIHEIEIQPLDDADCRALAHASGATAAQENYLIAKSLGFPGPLLDAAAALPQIDTAAATPFFESLSPEEQLLVAGLALPERLYTDELDLIFGAKKGAGALQLLLKKAGAVALLSQANDKSFQLSEGLRLLALSNPAIQESLKAYRQRWAPYGRIARRLEARADRAKLLQLSGLLWIDKPLCEALFADKAQSIQRFLGQQPTLFNRNRERYRISKRIRRDAQHAAKTLSPSSAAIRQKASTRWKAKETATLEQIETLAAKIETLQGEIADLQRRLGETQAHIRIQSRDTESKPEENARPKWLSFFGGKPQEDSAESVAGLSKLALDINHQIQEREAAIERLEDEQTNCKEILVFSYV